MLQDFFFVNILLHLPDALQCLFQFMVFAAKRDADIPFSVTSEDKSRRDKYACVVQHLFGQFFHVGAAIGNFSPEEHTYLFFIVCTSQCMHDFPCQMAAVAVVLVISVVPFLFGFQGIGGCQLHGAEHTASPAYCGSCSWS
mgnify:FL=1